MIVSKVSSLLKTDEIYINSFHIWGDSYFTPNMSKELKKCNLSFVHKNDYTITGVSCDSASLHTVMRELSELMIEMREMKIWLWIREYEQNKLVQCLDKKRIAYDDTMYLRTTKKGVLIYCLEIDNRLKKRLLTALEELYAIKMEGT